MEQPDAARPAEDQSPFLDALVADLQPVQPALAWGWVVLAWSALAGGFLVAAVLTSGSLRVGALDDLTRAGFALELTLGLATAVALLAAGLEIDVPGRPSRTRLLTPAVILALAWVGWTLAGHELIDLLEHPEISVVGKRKDCFVEGLAMSLLPGALALWSLRRRAWGAGWASGALVGMAAGALPATTMQLACMYAPDHALRFHLSPVLIAAGVGAILAMLLVRRS
jgi:hypothetical protein